MASIKISREFFAKAKADYSDWRWAWVREICQNSMDCGSTRIDVIIQRQGANTQIAVSNDGHPMTEEHPRQQVPDARRIGQGWRGWRFRRCEGGLVAAISTGPSAPAPCSLKEEGAATTS